MHTHRLLTEHEKLIGAYVSRDIAEKFNLITIAEHKNKSIALKNMVTEYVSNHELTVDTAITAIAKELFDYGQQQLFSVKCGASVLEAYLDEVRLALHRKNLITEYVEAIVDQISAIFKETYGTNKRKVTKRTAKTKSTEKGTKKIA